jgi:hypothetical protein
MMSGSRTIPAPDEHVWWNGLRWVEAAHMQVTRFSEAFDEEVRALTDADMRRRLNDDSDVSRSWRQSMDVNYRSFDQQRPLRVPSWSLHMQVATELDLLSVAVRNVLRAQARIPEQHRPEMGGEDVLELMRNVSEHWDEEGGRSASALAKDYPNVSVGGIAYTNKEIWIGGGDGVPISRILAWLGRVWQALVTCLTDAGIAVPEDLMTSRVEGDDELPWPAERLGYHWSIPKVAEEDWPREEMPPRSGGPPVHEIRVSPIPRPPGLEAKQAKILKHYLAGALDDPTPSS